MISEDVLTAAHRADAKGATRGDWSAASLPAQSVKLAGEMRAGLTRGEFFLVFQPQIDLLTQRIAGVEALVRWQHPRHRILLPNQFIRVAELSGLIVPLGNQMLRLACIEAARWRSGPLAGVKVSVSGYPLQLRHEGFIQHIASTLHQTGLPAERLLIQLPESAIVHPGHANFSVLKRLRQRGIRLAITGFGTGFSCLAYLPQVPVSSLKIDRSFLSDVPGNTRNEAVTRTIVELGRTLDLHLVAEGVETEAQADFLREIGCGSAQGPLYAPPQTASILSEWIRTWPAGTQAPRMAGQAGNSPRPGA
ncbi:EAL domain-containing protein [Devosia sp.]|uniref:EAL domain-containing protein n=1 Tax=Devosia sp. TaxID=1871048 RepID=UPI002FCAED0A